MQSSRTLASRSAKSWSSMLPLIRPPISIEIDSRREGRPTSLKPENTELLFFGFFDPRLVVELLSQLYPSSSYFITGGQGDNFKSMLCRLYRQRYGLCYYPARAEWVDHISGACHLLLEHNLLEICRRRYSGGDLMVFPIGAIALDVIALIPKMKASMESDGDFSRLELTTKNYLFAPFSFLSTAERGHSYARSTTASFIQTILFTKGNHFIPPWDTEDKVEDFFHRAFGHHTQAGHTDSYRYDQESSRLDISNLDASYICSGPFRLMLTTCLEKHLYLDKDGILYVFWDFTHEIGSSLDLYRGHFLWDPSGDLSECTLFEMFLILEL